jgi:hypothetical protein
MLGGWRANAGSNRRDALRTTTVLRWWATLFGGLLLGAGLVLHGQVRAANYLREEVANTFFLWRVIGRVTFMLHSTDRRTAMLLADIPEEYIRETERVALTLLVVGGLIVLAAPFLRQRRSTA